MTHFLHNNKNLRLYLSVFYVCIGVLIFLVSRNFGMFWDNVLFASKMGNQLYENGLFDWTMPNRIDPGHPPFLGFLLAITWKIFGHSLWASHLLMMPFVIGIFIQLHKLVYYFTNDHKISFFGLLLILVDPSLSAALVLVNPETIILFFFFLTINGILYDQKKWKTIGLLFLSIVSFRSMMLFAGIFLFDILNQKVLEKKKFNHILNVRFLATYTFTALPGIIFVLWRLFTKGWLQTHPDSPWSSLWHFPTIKEFALNLYVLGWRYADFGRIFVLLFLLISLIYLVRKKQINNSIRKLLLLSITSVLFVIFASIFSTNAFGHRYFIVSYIALTLASFLILTQLKAFTKMIYTLLLIGLITGNFWVYPEKVAQGWDATLAHIPYHSLRSDAMNYLDSEKIDFTEVGTFFPNYNNQDQIDLNGDQRRLSHFNKENKYIFYSNVYNLRGVEYDFIQKNYEEIKRFSLFQIYISILKRRSED